MDTSWINLPKHNHDYRRGVKDFLKLAGENLDKGRTQCPCKVCKVERWQTLVVVEEHLMSNGFWTAYDKWVYHGKGDVLENIVGSDIRGSGHTNKEYNNIRPDNISTLLGDLFGDKRQVPNVGQGVQEDYRNEEDIPEIIDHQFYHFPNPEPSASPEEEAKLEQLIAAADEPLYEGCTTFSKLSFILHLFHLKCMNKWSGESFTMLLNLLVDAFPGMSKNFPKSYYQGKQMINALGLGYEKIHACPNNCVLYWGKDSKEDKCPVCGTSRWKNVENEDPTSKKVAAKVLRYFPLIPRLRRIYRSSKQAGDMRWHESERVKDGKLRHPADGESWQAFDKKYPDFASDPRSVRLGLASDGFNPYRLMNTNYSTWPVVLIPNNLPPWLCMKSSSFILSLLIPGKYSPGIDIDIYLQPLIHELKQLWNGVEAFDAYEGQKFTMKAALQWTINDFPAYAMLSGWSTKGYNACPICTNSTPRVRFAGKICYTGFRKWLPSDHPYRSSQAELFDGKEDHDTAPVPSSGSDIRRQQEEVTYVYGQCKTQPNKKRRREEVDDLDEQRDGVEKSVTWTKRSIFFDLEYWEHVKLRHNLDVMHIEKNVCDLFLQIFLDMDKSRDDPSVRKALEEAGLMKHLWLKEKGKGFDMPPASYNMTNEEKERFLRVLQKLKVPDGYSSNLARCVNLKKRKLMGLKSHDNHVLMQDILPPALRASGATKVVDIMAELSAFFKYICSATLDIEELDNMQSKIVLVLCEMEKEFPPTFFTIMVHLLVHLVDEAKLGGPVYYRWMYPVERYLAHLKSHVTNKAQPEGSIAEGYGLEETIKFCSRYLDSVKTVFNRPKRNDDSGASSDGYLFESCGRPVGKEIIVSLDAKSLKQAHRYILIHSDELADLRKEFYALKRQQNKGRRLTDKDETDWTVNELSSWLQSQVHKIPLDTELGILQKSLAGGINNSVKIMKTYVINGYKFNTFQKDSKLKTQNSGVMVQGADGVTYYGRLTGIYEVDYFNKYRVVLFRCDWVDLSCGVREYTNGGVAVSFKKLMHTGRQLGDDPFIFSSQAKQVFYLEDEIDKGWLHVIPVKPRDLFDLGDDELEAEEEEE